VADLTYAICVKCSFEKAVLAFERFGQHTYLCPQCQHVWEARGPATPPPPKTTPS